MIDPTGPLIFPDSWANRLRAGTLTLNFSVEDALKAFISSSGDRDSLGQPTTGRRVADIPSSVTYSRWLRFKMMERAGVMQKRVPFGRQPQAAWAVAIAVLIALGLQQNPAAAQSENLKKSGTVTVSQTQIAFIGSGNLGGGKLVYQGKTYNFKIGGLGIGGFGVSTIEAKGEVYNLTNLKDFEGAYGQGRIGVVAGDISSTSKFWIENPNGVYIHLEGKRKGVALSLGADAIYIKFE